MVTEHLEFQLYPNFDQKITAQVMNQIDYIWLYTLRSGPLSLEIDSAKVYVFPRTVLNYI